MGLPNEVNSALIGAAAAGGVYEIEQSLRFNNPTDAHYLNRTPSTAGNRRTFTYSGWHKFVGMPDALNKRRIFSARSDNSDTGWFAFIMNPTDDNRLEVQLWDHAVQTDGRLRDFSAWYHIVLAVDTTQATATDRVKIYLNGVRASMSTRSGSGFAGFTQNLQTAVNNTTAIHNIGTQANDTNTALMPMYAAEIHFVDGTALDQYDFGEFDDNNVWRPINVSGLTYGTNGYYLNFSNSSDLGEDQAGSNDWTANNFTTSGTGTDVMSDTPTKNWATLNPLWNPIEATYAEGNLKFTGGSTHSPSASTISASSGKYYFEATALSGSVAKWSLGIIDTAIGYRKSSGNNYIPGYNPNNVYSEGDAISLYDNNIYKNGSIVVSSPFSGGAIAAGDVAQMAVDIDAGKIWFGINGIWNNGGGTEGAFNPSGHDTTFAANDDYIFHFTAEQCGWDVNFGQREFAYPPGTASATSYFNTVTWTGNGTNNRTITGVGFQPDFVWVKNRSDSDGWPHILTDVVRGGGPSLQTNSTGVEVAANSSGYVSAFASDGFVVTEGDTRFANTNGTGASYVAWCWKAGGTASSNTNGSITSSVSANQDAGFSIVTYTGTGSAATVGHGLGVAPAFIVIKCRNKTFGWTIYHQSLGNTRHLEFGSGTGYTGDAWNSTNPTSTVFSVGTDAGSNNGSAAPNNYVAYCFAEKTGISKIGSYTGNGSNTGPFVECGFKPRFVMLKRTDASSNWFIYDTVRGTNNKLYAETSTKENAEDGGSTSSNTILSLSSGFQLTSGNGSNSSGGTYIFMAFAENFSADSTYKDLNTANLPVPEIKDGSDYFQTVLWDGDGATSRDITTNFSPDFAIIKQRNDIYGFGTYDIVRGGGKFLRTDGTDTETTNPADGYVSAFNSTSVTLAKGSYGWNVNGSGYTYVGWFWDGGGTGSSNTDGSITSTVSVNQSAGFSVVSYTGNVTAGATVGHGLGVPPDMMIIKHRNSTYEWVVYHSSLDASAPEDYYIALNDTGERAGPNTNIWQSTAPTSTTFKIGDVGQVNADNQPHIAYCFAEVEGYSKFGSYVGNDNADGPFVYTGFKPAWVMVKSYSSGHTYNWVVVDAARDPYNVMNKQLFPNNATSESTGVSTVVDFLSNGFKWRYGSNGFNGPSVSYIFAAFAENPFGGIGVSPATAR